MVKPDAVPASDIATPETGARSYFFHFSEIKISIYE